MDFEKLVVPFGADVTELVKGMDKASSEAEGFANKLANIGKAAVVGAIGLVTTGVAALTGVIATSIGKTNEWAGEMDSIQDILGGTSEEAAGLNLMMKRIGGSTDQVTGAIKKMAMGLNTLDKDGFSKTEKSLKKLGINLKDTNGKMKDSYQIFAEVSDVVSQMPDGLEKDAILMDIFGKSGAELGDALNAAANGGMKNFQEEATKLKLAIDPQRTIEFQKAQQRLDDTFNGLWVTLGNSLMPALTRLLNWFSDFVQSPAVQNFITPVLDGIGKAVDAFVTGTEKGGIFKGFLDGLASFNSPFLNSIVEGIQNCLTWFETFKTAITTDFGDGSIVQNALSILATTWDIVKTAVVKVWEVLTGQTDPAMQAIGNETAPNVAKAMKDINTQLEKFYDWLTTLSPETWKLIAAIGTFLIVGIPLIKFLTTLIGLLNIGSGGLTAFGLAAGFGVGPIGWLIAAIVLLGTTIAFFGKDAWNTLDMLQKMFWALWKVYVYPFLKDTVDWFGRLGGALAPIGRAFDSIASAVGRLISQLARLVIPSWLTPGSPTPLELGILGINDALKKVNNASLPEFSTKLDIEGTLSSNNQNSAPLDENRLALIIRDAVLQAVG